MNNWLSDFHYRVNFNGYLFVTGATLVTSLAFLTIVVQAYKIAYASPAGKMRSD
jgi:hypothetical protein